jgi:hypothetical protein
MPVDVAVKPSVVWNRRNVVQIGGAILAGTGGLRLARVAAEQSTPVTAGSGKGLLLVQTFSHGSLFPTQGEAGVLPYTLILWDAADRGLFFIADQDGVAGLAPTDSLLIAIEAGARPMAAVVVPAGDGSGGQQVWALQLAYGRLGSDPGAVTYQGDAVDGEATAWLGVTPEPLSNGVQDLAAGFLVIGGLRALDLPEGTGVRITLR